jgi:hypothetical protein
MRVTLAELWEHLEAPVVEHRIVVVAPGLDQIDNRRVGRD